MCYGVQVFKRRSRVELVRGGLAAFIDDVEKRVMVGGIADFRIEAV